MYDSSTRHRKLKSFYHRASCLVQFYNDVSTNRPSTIAFEMPVSHVKSFLNQETRVFVGSLGAKDLFCALRKQ